MNPFIPVLTAVGTALYFAAFLLYLPPLLRRLPKKLPHLPAILWGMGEAANLAVILSNFLQNGYVPFVSMFQVLTFLAACFLPVCLFIRFACRCRNTEAWFSLASAIVLTGPCFMRSGAVWSFPPALQSPWFVPHILMYMLAYSLGTVAFLLTLVSFFEKPSKKAETRNTVYCCCRTLFPFMSAGMLFGSIWADQVWGGFWNWDLKECWSLITWLLYMLLLHCARRKKLRPLLPLFSILGFAGIVVTMFFVRAMVSGGGSSLHTYS